MPRPRAVLVTGSAGRIGRAVCAELHVTSRPVGVTRYDPEPARTRLGYEPQDRWPEGLGFAPDPGAARVEERTP